MKLAYIVLLGYGPSTGVEKATQGRAIAARALGLTEIEFVILNPTKEGVINNVRYVRYGIGDKAKGFLMSLFRRYRLVETYIDLKGYDSIILRYPFADMTGSAVVHRHRIITEHHTYEPQEIALGFATAPSVSLRAAKLIRLALEKHYGPRTLRHARGTVGLTDEIRRFELSRAGIELPSTVVANGIDVSNCNHTGFRQFDGRELNLVIVSSAFQPWLGLDRILEALTQYEGAVSITLHLVGTIRHDAIDNIDHNNLRVRVYGRQSGAKLDQILSGMNIAIGSMALFRKGMRQACALKTREYMARGLPFLNAHEDPDLAPLASDSDFYLPIPNDNSPIDVEAIIDFAKSASDGGRHTSLQMREYAEQRMDWRVKVPRYLEFAQTLVDSQAA